MTEANSCEVSFVHEEGPRTGQLQATRLADMTTLRVGGPAREVVVATTEEELLDAVRSADEAGLPVLVLGGGSNVLVSDDGFPGRVVRVETRGIDAVVSDCGGASVTVAAGENWDDFVARTIAEGWIGVEALSGIPGRVGATPIQNVGAYGAEVAQTVTQVRTWDRERGEIHTFAAVDCEFGYRASRFKREPGRYLVLSVGFQFRLGTLAAPAHPQLAAVLGTGAGERATTAQVRDAVLAIRRSKGMVLDEADHDTWSAGSFFTNPVLTPETADALPPEAPRFPTADGKIKSSAAWLIEHAGFARGHGTARASLSTKHTLALTNRGDATAADLVALANEVVAGVWERFGVELVPEVNLIGTSLAAPSTRP